MNLALDTNTYNDFMRGVPEVVELVEDAVEIYLPFIVLAELRGAFLAGSKRRQNETMLELFLKDQDVRVLHTDEETVRCYAEIYCELKTKGRMIPTNDLWIAAIVLQHGLTLCSRDSHFDHLPQILRV